MDTVQPPADPAVPSDQQLRVDLAQYVQTSIQEALANYAPPAPPEPVPNPGTRPGKKVHVARPSDFNGQNFEDFQRQVELYVAAASADLTSDLDRVLFVLSFMKEGNAATWAQNWIEGHRIGSLIRLRNDESYSGFMGQLRTSFVDPNEKRNAQNKLASLRQGKRSADAFFQEFDILARKAGFATGFDDILVGMLEKALHAELVDKILGVTPVLTAYTEWRARAISFDQAASRMRQVRAERPHLRPVPTVPIPRVEPPVIRDQPVPMDIGETRKPGACFACGKLGHQIRDCPQKRQHIRQVIGGMTSDERDLWKEAFFATPEVISELPDAGHEPQDFVEAQQ